MAKTRKTWRENWEIEQQPKVVDDTRGRGEKLIPTPPDVDALIHKLEEAR